MLQSQISCTLKDHNISAQEKYKKNRSPVEDHIEIIFPKHNTYFAIDPNIKLSRQVLDIDYISQFNVQNIKILVDGVRLNSSKWQLKKGKHKITVSGQLGASKVEDYVIITVL